MVSYSSLTDHSAITQAFDEFDKLGRELFLIRYGFKEVNESFVVARSGRYDTRALFAAAYEYQTGDALSARQITGFAGAATQFTALGYVVVGANDQKDRERFTSFDAALSRVRIPVENMPAIREFLARGLYAEYYVPASGAYIGLKPRSGKPPHFVAAGYIAHREDDGRARGFDLPYKPALRRFAPSKQIRPASSTPSTRVASSKPSTPQSRAAAAAERHVAYCETCFLALPATGICPNCDD
ncbi:hypothetical protein GCM10009860_23020 [Microbacterium mitrae]|uniref:ScoMcrA-like N-terminal head domain-containing protein n=1 Tax=Microbacterium mitrae TaxID=664640 RepID=A0A5C8HN12_9MICO|nr:hypothetical protein [Microbacterium mitrae]TXK04019.1 hypothetical protein FVP60_09605 [Microbacterium mitrae]